MTHGSLFSGIGGFDLAAQKMGWENVFHCEWNPFGQKILKYYWPEAISYEDIKKTDFSIHRGTIDVLTGGFPCQPYSLAGLRKGKEDERHLWPEMLRAIREIKPRWVVGENVLGLVGWNDGMVFEEVQTDLEAEGYEVQPYVLPAASVDAPHRRDRVWFIAYSGSRGFQRGAGSSGKIEDHTERTFTNSNNYGSHATKDRQIMEERVRGDSSRENPTFKLEGCPQQSTTLASNTDGLCKEQREQEIGGVWFEPVGCSEDVADPNNINGDLSGFCTGGLSQQQKADLPGDQSSIDDANSASFRRGQDNGQGIAGFSNKSGSGSYWSNWPTQSPVCNGDDGISSKLDGITFPKWRTESIKAGGNAIVHQVVLQIFKAIQEYETTTRRG